MFDPSSFFLRHGTSHALSTGTVQNIFKHIIAHFKQDHMSLIRAKPHFYRKKEGIFASFHQTNIPFFFLIIRVQ